MGDIERVNIVINYDMPEDSDTYLHRVARAGRFGTKGLAISFISEENDAKVLNDVQDRFEVNVSQLPTEIEWSWFLQQWIQRNSIIQWDTIYHSLQLQPGHKQYPVQVDKTNIQLRLKLLH